ncbi:MAG: hypothetical protein PHE27_06045 [Alphaproteobacteria bacterium]|nr:hypothetical protein [Alphaproteobacteria bacterium]
MSAFGRFIGLVNEALHPPKTIGELPGRHLDVSNAKETQSRVFDMTPENKESLAADLSKQAEALRQKPLREITPQNAKEVEDRIFDLKSSKKAATIPDPGKTQGVVISEEQAKAIDAPFEAIYARNKKQDGDQLIVLNGKEVSPEDQKKQDEAMKKISRAMHGPGGP